MRRLTLLLLFALAACTPQQHRAWLDWYQLHPRAAIRFALAGCGDLGCTVQWSDVTTGEDIFDEPDQTGGQDTAGVYEPWISLAVCESGSNPPDWHIDTGNGYYGGLQFAWSSWEAVGGSGNPAHASPSEQVMRGELLQDAQGWEAWPTCARIIGLL